MELSPIFHKLFPAPPGSQAPSQVPRGQYGYTVPLALRPYARPPPGMSPSNTFSMEMLRANHAAHVTGGVHSPHKVESWSNVKIEPLHPEVLHLVEPQNSFHPQEGMRKRWRNHRGRKRGVQRQATTGIPSLQAASIATFPSKTVVSSTNAPGGGKIVSSRDEEGQIHVRIEYDRNEMIRFAHSPYSVLPPTCLKDIVMNYPEILRCFPQRHGVDLCPSCEEVS